MRLCRPCDTEPPGRARTRYFRGAQGLETRFEAYSKSKPRFSFVHSLLASSHSNLIHLSLVYIQFCMRVCHDNGYIAVKSVVWGNTPNSRLGYISQPCGVDVLVRAGRPRPAAPTVKKNRPPPCYRRRAAHLRVLHLQADKRRRAAPRRRPLRPVQRQREQHSKAPFAHSEWLHL